MKTIRTWTGMCSLLLVWLVACGGDDTSTKEYCIEHRDPSYADPTQVAPVCDSLDDARKLLEGKHSQADGSTISEVKSGPRVDRTTTLDILRCCYQVTVQSPGPLGV